MNPFSNIDELINGIIGEEAEQEKRRRKREREFELRRKEAELQQNHPAVKDAWGKYQTVLKLAMDKTA